MTTFSRKFEEKTDIWTVFVRGTHGEILTFSDMKASSRGSKVYYSLSAKTGIPHNPRPMHDIVHHDDESLTVNYKTLQACNSMVPSSVQSSITYGTQCHDNES